MPMATGFTPAGDPHAGSRILHAGAPLAEAHGAAILVHGRGASAEDILDLASHFRQQDTAMAWLAPQADGHTWYPYRFLEPIERNEPHLSSALALLGRLVREANGAGVPSERIALLGFSQGGVIASALALAEPARWRALAALSTWIPGDLVRSLPAVDRSRLEVLVQHGTGDDMIDVARARESVSTLRALGIEADSREYAMGHEVNARSLADLSAWLGKRLLG